MVKKVDSRTAYQQDKKIVRDGMPIDLQMIAVGFTFFALCALVISFRLIFWADTVDPLREQAIYWFGMSLLAICILCLAHFAPQISRVFPFIKELSLGKFLDIKFEELTTQVSNLEIKIDQLSSTRYANLVYLIDRAGNLAMVQRHQYNNRWLPCGTRLALYETPHEAVYRAISQELGLSAADYEFWPKHNYKQYENTKIVPRPYQVQSEEHPHAAEKGEPINKHYDFVYVCKTEQLTPKLTGSIKSRWFSPTEFFMEITLHKQRGREFTFLDIEITYKKLLVEMGQFFIP